MSPIPRLPTMGGVMPLTAASLRNNKDVDNKLLATTKWLQEHHVTPAQLAYIYYILDVCIANRRAGGNTEETRIVQDIPVTREFCNDLSTMLKAAGYHTTTTPDFHIPATTSICTISWAETDKELEAMSNRWYYNTSNGVSVADSEDDGDDGEDDTAEFEDELVDSIIDLLWDGDDDSQGRILGKVLSRLDREIVDDAIHHYKES